jgi:hypothetical protein
MANNKKDFSDKDFNCKKCRARLALERFDRQCLIVGSAAFFNFARFACLNCEAVNSWEAPNLLPTNEEKSISRYPDSLRDVPQPEKRILEACLNRETYGIRQHKSGKFVVQVGGYIGSYETHDEAKAVRDVALAKQFGYTAKDKQNYLLKADSSPPTI